MPEVTINIGGRDYAVACQEGEEQFLHAAARLLDAEAAALAGQANRLPESRMLLMAGLMLADKTAGVEEQLRAAEARMSAQEAEMERMRAGSSGAGETPPPERVEVLPDGLSEELEVLAGTAEALAEQVERKAAAG